MTDKAQQQAILHVHGPCLTIAGPGAGKTYVLVRRIAYLTESLKIPPGQLLVITFTRAAALEMKKRYLEAVPPPFHGVSFGTFHSIFFSILREQEHLSYQSILDSKTKDHILKTACIKAGSYDQRIPELLSGVAGEISYIKNTLTPLSEYEPKNMSNEAFQTVFRAYESQKKDLERVDFDDMQSHLKELFYKRPEALQQYQKRYRFFLVDEAQDMNAIQYELLQMLATPPYNLFLVGDDDQAIYSFRGARPELFLGFTKDYPDAKVISLTNNYRCDKTIVSSGLKLISTNTVRFEKKLRSASRLEGKIRFLTYKNAEEEAADIARRIRLEKEKTPETSIAVLYRTNVRNEALFAALKANGLVGAGKRSEGGWFHTRFVQTVVCYLSSAAETIRRDALLCIMNAPERYLPRKGLEEEIVDFREWAHFQTDPGTAKRILSFQQALLRLAPLPTVAAIHYVLFPLGYARYAKEQKVYDEEALQQLMALARRYPDKRKFLEAFETLKAEAKDHKKTPEEGKDTVHCYTFHGSKGLEFDHVYIVDANEGIVPSRRATGQKAIEEERRMFYVAMTRAKHTLTIANTMRLGNEELYPSRFVKELLGDKTGGGYSSSSPISSSKSSSNTSET